ncbi:MAG: ABC transporter permease [Treponema sp.]|jgi:ribose/xylose/arabinose/galactoside ABC-type transport system permease subunit|nr:ABC transporter permease [Treponema sp.]
MNNETPAGKRFAVSGRGIGRTINDYRFYVLIALMLFLGIFARNFFTAFNIKGIFDSTVLYAMIGLGFTICMIAGHMDLSVGAMANMGAVLVMGMHTLSKMGWFPSIAIAVAAGLIVGFLNGILICKAKIHSFITTLGMQFVLRGAMYIYCGGAEIGDKGDYGFADILNMRLGFLPLSPKVIVVLFFVIIVAVLMRNTRWGRNIYLIGGNYETAWLAGIKSDAITVSVFMLSGLSCAVGGAIFAICQSSALPNLGEKGISPLLVALAATIIGGTATTGGRGSVWNTYASVLALMVMSNVLTSLSGKYEVQILSNGLVLAACVFYETIANYYRSKRIGARALLLEELARKSG